MNLFLVVFIFIMSIVFVAKASLFLWTFPIGFVFPAVYTDSTINILLNVFFIVMVAKLHLIETYHFIVNHKKTKWFEAKALFLAPFALFIKGDLVESFKHAHSSLIRKRS